MSKDLIVKERKITEKQLVFCENFAITNDDVASYRMAFTTKSLRDDRVAGMARNILLRPEIQRTIRSIREERSEQMLFTAKDILQEWYDIATADPNELVSIHIDACRHCHGIDHRYQWRDAEEFFQAVSVVMAENAQRDANDQLPMPSAEGGYGYRFSRDANPDCPKCEGRGHTVVLYKDTTKLSPKARKLYAGVKQTKYGIEVLMHNQETARTNFAKALGMFAEIVKLDAFMKSASVELNTDDPNEAAAFYNKLMRGAE